MIASFNSLSVSPLRKGGFTIVELLIVIVVIGILAAITIVAFNGVQRRAAQSVVQNDLAQAIREIENHRTLNNTLPATAAAVDGGRGLKASEGTTYEYTLTGATFCVTATSPRAATSYYYDSSVGRTQEGACTGHIGYSSSPGTGVHALAAGGHTACQVYNGQLYCWGANNFKQNGNGTTTNVLSPALAATAGGVLTGKVVTLADSGYYHSCALADGSLYCWGYGYLGNGVNHTANNGSDAVVVNASGVLAGKTITALDIGFRRTCVIADGAPYCWGPSYPGNGGAGGTTSPVAVTTSGVLSGKVITKLSTGGDFSCVIADNAPYCWGNNSAGQLGDASTTASTTPVAVVTSGVLAGKTITDMSSSMTELYGHTCVIADGAPYCWGDRRFGALGNNTGGTSSAATSSPVATTVSGVLSGRTITKIVAGNNSTCVLADARPFCWGYNIYGQLGNNASGGLANQNNPVSTVVSGALSGKTLTDIAAGDWHYCAKDTDQAVYCWGRNDVGQHGATVTSDLSVPRLRNALP